jgi:hypothetical protein
MPRWTSASCLGLQLSSNIVFDEGIPSPRQPPLRRCRVGSAPRAADKQWVRTYPRPLVTIPLVLVALAWGVTAFHWFWLTGLVALSALFIWLWVRGRRNEPEGAVFRSDGWARAVCALGITTLVVSWLAFFMFLSMMAPAVRSGEPCNTLPPAAGRDCHREGAHDECGEGSNLRLVTVADFARPDFYRHCTFVLGF